MTKLVIAEKPMLARDIARAVCGEDVSESARLPISGNGYTVVACAGHLLELVDPGEADARWGKPWALDVLPIALYPWPKKPAQGKEALVQQIAELLDTCDSVINAGDPDDEGQLIVDEVLDYLGYKGKVERVYVNDNIAANIRRAFDRLLPNEQCRGVGRAALARSIADFCFGINETRLATKKCGALLTVGRVQTPTLGLVVQRDEAITNHVKKAYYDVFAKCEGLGDKAVPFRFKPSKDTLADEKHLLSMDVPHALERALSKTHQSFVTKVTEQIESPPLPYNLTVLLSDMSARYKFSAAKTQQITQDLRDNYKAITYNRTDCQYLKSEHFEQAAHTCSCAMKNLGVNWACDFSRKSKAFNDANVSAHHAIIPQDISLDIGKMTDEQRKVYCAIVERYAAQFMEPQISDVSISTFETEYGSFACKCKRIKQAGFKAVLGSIGDERGEDDRYDGWIDAGEHICTVASIEVVEKQTKPKAPYTEGTLITDMASVAKYVSDPAIKNILKLKDENKKGEHGGIGTTATRSSIIEGLKKHGLLAEQKGKIRSTELGRAFYHILPDDIKSVDTTAKWWLIQQDVAEGKADVGAIQQSVVDTFLAHRDTAYQGICLAQGGNKVVGKCPKCGGDVYLRGKKYTCSSNKIKKDASGKWHQVAGCGFGLWSSIAGKKLPESAVKQLLDKGRTTTKVKGFVSKKTGRKYDAHLEMDKDGNCRFTRLVNSELTPIASSSRR